MELTETQQKLLDYINGDMNKNSCTKEMCEMFNMQRYTLHAVLKALERKGYIKIKPQEKLGARIKRV